MKTSLGTNLLGAESHGSGGKVRDGQFYPLTNIVSRQRCGKEM